MSAPFPFEVWAKSIWDGTPFRVGRYATRVDAERAMQQWSHMDCWIEVPE